MSTAVILMAYALATRITTADMALWEDTTVQQQLWAIQYTVTECSNN